MVNIILQQDDAAPDSLDSFIEDLKIKFGLNYTSLHTEIPIQSGDGMCLEWHYHGYILSYCADDPYHSLSLKSNGSVTVVNKHHKKFTGNTKHCNIMRGSIFGNPYVMEDKSYAERLRVIGSYTEHLKGEWGKGSKNPLRREIVSLARRLNNGERLELVCCCKPSVCHGDVLSKWVYKVAEKLRVQLC